MEGHPHYTAIGKSFGIGIVGLGEGKGLVKGLSGHPELKAVAVCDRDAELVERVQRQYEVPYGFNNLDELLKLGSVNIVVIFTPDKYHLEHIRLAFEAGKHVICTKPLVNSLDEAFEVLTLTQKHPDLRLMVGQSSRFFGPMLRQRAAYEKGMLGNLGFAEAQYVHDMRWFYEKRPWAKEGSFDLIMNGCSHPVDLIRWYMGDVDEVHAYGDRSFAAGSAKFRGKDIFVVNIRFTSGRIGRVLGLYGLEQAHHLQPWIEICLYGERGTFIARYPQLEAITKYSGEDERLETYFEDIYHYFQFEGVNHHAGEFLNYTEYFALCLISGERPQPDALDGFKTIATLEAVRQSVLSGQPQKVVNPEMERNR